MGLVHLLCFIHFIHLGEHFLVNFRELVFVENVLNVFICSKGGSGGGGGILIFGDIGNGIHLVKPFGINRLVIGMLYFLVEGAHLVIDQIQNGLILT